jgi:ribosomal protein S18 acetylase RimI-like enzyme
VLVRPAKPADADAIARAHVRAWQHAYAGLFPDEELARLDPVQRAAALRRRLATPEAGRATLAVEEGESVIGFASVGPSRDDDGDGVGELYAIYVEPELWGRGAGRGLMRGALDALRDAGYAEATLWVLEENPRARRFYEASGWSTDGTAKDDTYLGTEVREVRYRISL